MCVWVGGGGCGGGEVAQLATAAVCVGGVHLLRFSDNDLYNALPAHLQV